MCSYVLHKAKSCDPIIHSLASFFLPSSPFVHFSFGPPPLNLLFVTTLLRSPRSDLLVCARPWSHPVS